MSNKTESTIGIFIFAAVCCVCASALLAGSEVKLADLIAKNKKLDLQRSVLMAADLASAKTTNEEIEAWFKKDENGQAYINPMLIDLEGNKYEGDVTVANYIKRPKDYPEILLVYECIKEDDECYILHVTGKGLWGPLQGYLALKKDANSILGLSFYNHKETPGLGAEITEPWFRNQFKSKKLFTEAKKFETFRGVKVKKAGILVANEPEAEQPFYADGISGATITSDGVTFITQDFIKKFIPWLKKKSA